MEKYIPTFLQCKLLKDKIFSKWRGHGLANKDTMFWISETGDNKFWNPKGRGYVLSGGINKFVIIHIL